MSEAQGPGELPPPAPRPKTFQVFWSDNDRPVSDYTGITGSNLNDQILVLIKHDRELLINMGQVRLVMIVDDD